MKQSLVAILCAAAIGMASCKKESNSVKFNPEGYWRGSAYLYHTAILNKPGGVSRLYLRFPATDTASAELKGDGKYTLSGNYFRAAYNVNQKDSIVIESYNASSPNLKGTLILATGEIVSFDFIKQN
jgi:hypothetical protein